MADSRTRWAISLYWPFGWRRWVVVRQMTRERALWIGRHLWRLKYLGARYFQVEEGAFPTSFIPTQGEPVRREADVLSFRLSAAQREQARRGDYPTVYSEMFGVETLGPIWGNEEDTERSTPPRFTKEGYRLIEGTRTNYALHSEAPRV